MSGNGTHEETGTADDAIIGGVAANSPKLNAIGSLGYNAGDGVFRPVCTGTLITPTMVLTAEHCVDFESDPKTQLAFLIGPDANAPIKTVPVRGVAWEDTVQGGVVGLGVDVAIMHLAVPVTDVTPMPYAQLTPEKVGQRFIGVGYGIRDANQDYGTRRAGSMTLQQVGGKLYQAIYGTFDKFLADAKRYGFDPKDPNTAITFQQAWDSTLLLDGIEGWFGNGPNDAQSCFGDSGGPIAFPVDGKTTVFGVASWVSYYDSNRVCGLGAAYATLEPVGLDFIAYQTGCPLVPKAGTCEGLTTAVRCIPPAEGGYRTTKTDCGALGGICGIDATGELGCIDDPCDGIPAEGVCNGTVATRCTHANEGARRVVTTDCAALGGTCGIENGEVACMGGCAHEVCAQGTALTTSCGACTTSICAVDPYCCNTAWDSICIGEVASVCHETCPGALASNANRIGFHASTR